MDDKTEKLQTHLELAVEATGKTEAELRDAASRLKSMGTGRAWFGVNQKFLTLMVPASTCYAYRWDDHNTLGEELEVKPIHCGSKILSILLWLYHNKLYEHLPDAC